MRILYSWLKQLVNTDLEPGKLADVLTMGGLEVEEIQQWQNGAGGEAETVLLTKVTANRGDLLSIAGVARHTAALLGLPFEAAEYSIPETRAAIAATGEAHMGPVTVEVADPDGCPRYSALLIEGVKIGPSPDWMRRRLEASGVRTINNVVDCTNYVVLELGQPLHAFDFSLLQDSHIIVRKARGGEKITTLDGQERELGENDLLICDPSGPVALAGIMGGGNSEMQDSSTAVLLESAHFDPATIRKTSLRLGLSTEASYRFERHVDPNLTLPALARVAELIMQTAGGAAPGPALDVKAHEFAPPSISMRPARCNKILGTELTGDQMAEYLRRIGCSVSVQDDGRLEAVVPTVRPDIEREIDLIEEVAIVLGYNNIALTIPGDLPAAAVLTQNQRVERLARQILRACGLNETISFAMTNPRLFDQMCLTPDCAAREALPLASPMSEDHSVLRTMLLPSLLGAVQGNINQRVADVALYEINTVYIPQSCAALPKEPKRVAGVITGSALTSRWNLQQGESAVDFYWLKGLVEQLCDGLGLRNISFKRAGHDSFHPGRCAALMIGDIEAGVFGEISEQVQENFDVPARIYAFELDFDLMLSTANLQPTYSPLPRFPAALRDVAVLAADSDEHAAARLEEAIRSAGGPYLASVAPFDSFADAQRLGAGNKSIAFSLQFRAPDRALTGEEVDASMSAIHSKLEELGAEVRRA